MDMFSEVERIKQEHPNIVTALAICDDALAIYFAVLAVTHPVKVYRSDSTCTNKKKGK